jgi:hypothetical protein
VKSIKKKWNVLKKLKLMWDDKKKGKIFSSPLCVFLWNARRKKNTRCK